MIGARVTKDRYTIDPLYQWDKNQVLQIYGLSLPSIPEIHFSNKTMNNAIVKQASMDKAGVVTVDIPNSLLEQSHDIIVYICTYEGDAFKCLYKMIIPVYPKKKPDDYITPPDNTDEVYSYNALENLFVNAIALSIDNYEKAKADYESMSGEISKATKTLETATEALKAATGDFDFAKSELTQAKAILEDASTKYDAADDILIAATNNYNQAIDNYNAALQAYEDASAVLAQVASVEYVNASVKKAAPRNLLDNSDFRDPVNQRGLDIYTSGYCLDRWRIYADNTSMAKNSGYITITGSGIWQNVPNVGNKVYTFAGKKTDGTIYVCSGKFENGVATSGGELVFNFAATSYNSVMIGEGNWLWVALYEGEYTVDTLPEYQYKGYAVELAECQRYFIAYNFSEVLLNARVFGSNPKYADITLPAPGILRTNPTVINSLNYCAVLVSNTGWEGKITSASASGNMVNLVFETNDGTDMIASTIGSCRIIGNLMLSADL